MPGGRPSSSNSRVPRKGYSEEVVTTQLLHLQYSAKKCCGVDGEAGGFTVIIY